MSDNSELGKERIEGQSIGKLRARLDVGTWLIRQLRKDDDPRAKEAIDELQRQQQVINEVLVRKIREERAARGEAEPEPVVVGMRAVRLRGRAAGR